METLCTAYIRGCAARTGTPALPKELLEKPLDMLTPDETSAIYSAGKAAGLKLYRFKDHDVLPRVHKVLGFLRAVWPESLLDVGSGRGVFLFPFLRAFPGVPVTSLDILDHRVEFLSDLRRGGMDMLNPMLMNICEDKLPEKSFDVVTLLEVLEHIPDVAQAIRSAVRLARRYVVVTVPSKPDNNPEHIHLLTKDILTGLFTAAGCSSLRFDGVNGHLFMTASVGQA